MNTPTRSRTRNLSLGPLVQHKPPSPRPGRNHTTTSRKQTHNNTKESGLKNSTQNPGLDNKHGGAAPDMGRCTRYVAVHPLRGGAPEQKRCIAYGSGAAPQQTRTNAELTHRTTHRRTPPCAPGPYWRQDGHAAHAATCTPAHSDTSYILTCEEPANHILTEHCSVFHTGI